MIILRIEAKFLYNLYYNENILSEIFQTKFSYVLSLFIINQHVIVVILVVSPPNRKNVDYRAEHSNTVCD